MLERKKIRIFSFVSDNDKKLSDFSRNDSCKVHNRITTDVILDGPSIETFLSLADYTINCNGECELFETVHLCKVKI